MILMNDFKREEESLISAQLHAVERVLRSGWYVLGNEVKAFETEWSTWSGATNTVGVGNGMDALEIGIRALGIGPGDEIITTPMTAFATVLSIYRAGAVPVLADIDPDTGILDPDSVETCITPRTKAVMVVHLYGQSAPLDRFSALATNHGIALIEDCAQAHGAKFNGKACGTWGTFAGWSFYPTKNLGAIGDGGALTTESKEIDERSRRLRNYGQSVRYYHSDIGLNSRLDELQAAILRERLRHLTQWTEQRRSIASALYAGISNQRVRALPLPTEKERHVHHLFVLTTPKRDNLLAHLKAAGIDSLCHYPVPVHRQECCNGIRIAPGSLPRAEAHAATCLSIPCHPSLTSEEISKIVDSVNQFAG
ncbi:MAG: hypothetical protein RL173_171 [Fibrobacterota bacterium]|jgi:dTDP-4-amino-4,6-dideoxygalactose transaminase